LNSEEIKAILSSIDILIDIKSVIRKIVPTYHLDESSKDQFIILLKSLHKRLQPIFSKYLIDDDESKISQELINNIIKSLGNKNMALISANSSKKKLKSIGIDPRDIIVTGGPINYKDYKIINPNLTDNALTSIKKKCERIINQIRNEDWSHKDLIFIYETENATDKLILSKIEDISSLIGRSVRILEIRTWKDLEN